MSEIDERRAAHRRMFGHPKLPEECDHEGDWEDVGDAFVCEACGNVFEKEPEHEPAIIEKARTMINREGEFMPGAETRADDEAGLLRRTFRLIESMSRMTEPNGDGEDDANTLSRLLEISREIQRDRRRLRLLHKWTGE